MSSVRPCQEGSGKHQAIQWPGSAMLWTESKSPAAVPALYPCSVYQTWLSLMPLFIREGQGIAWFLNVNAVTLSLLPSS